MKTSSVPKIYFKILDKTTNQFYLKRNIEFDINQILKSDKNKERFEFELWSLYILSILKATTNSGIGYAFGLNCKVTSHGALGLSMLVNKNIESLIYDLVKFYNIGAHKISLDIIKNKNITKIILQPLFYSHPKINISDIKKLDNFFIESALISIASNLQEVSKTKININIDCKWKKPNYHVNYKNNFQNLTFNFNQNQNQICINNADLKNELLFSDNDAYIFTKKILESEYIIYSTNEGNIINKVNKALELSPTKKLPDIKYISEQLSISENTLVRKLAMAGTNFSKLVQEHKFNLAKKLMDSDKTIKEVSVILGYSHVNSFFRAFHQWAGVPPKEYRRIKKKL